MQKTEQEFLKELDKKLWTAADKLRSNLDAAVYKHAVLGLVFLKYVSDSFELRQQEAEKMLKDPKSDFFMDPSEYGRGGRSSALPYEEAIRAELEVRDYYTQQNVFWMPALARWKTMQDSAKLPAGTEITLGGSAGTGARSRAPYTISSLGKLIDDALEAIERENPKLKNVLNKTYTQLQLDPANLGSLIDLIATIPFVHPGSSPGQASLSSKDILGHPGSSPGQAQYEYFLGQFALAETTEAGSTRPKSIVSPAGATKYRASASSSLRAAPSGARLSSAHSALRLGRILSSMRPSPRLAWPNDSRACHPRPALRGTLSCACEPFKGRVYDPAMGSGGFFVQSAEFVDAAADTDPRGRGDTRVARTNAAAGSNYPISVYGQESNPTTPGQARGRLWRLAAMNMAIRGIDFNFGKEPANSFTNEEPALARTMMANPPFNVKGACPAPEFTSGVDPGWWDARLEGDRSKVWACRRSKAAPSGLDFTPGTDPGLQVLAPKTALRAFRSNPSREMRDHVPTLIPA